MSLAIQGRILAWMKREKDGKSRKIPERFFGESRGMFQIRDQGLKWANPRLEAGEMSGFSLVIFFLLHLILNRLEEIRTLYPSSLRPDSVQVNFQSRMRCLASSEREEQSNQ